MNERQVAELGVDVERIAMLSLGLLRIKFVGRKLSDRDATMALFFYLATFTKNGWKGSKPSEVFSNASRVCVELGFDTASPPLTKTGEENEQG